MVAGGTTGQPPDTAAGGPRRRRRPHGAGRSMLGRGHSMFSCVRSPPRQIQIQTDTDIPGDFRCSSLREQQQWRSPQQHARTQRGGGLSDRHRRTIDPRGWQDHDRTTTRQRGQTLRDAPIGVGPGNGRCWAQLPSGTVLSTALTTVVSSRTAQPGGRVRVWAISVHPSSSSVHPSIHSASTPLSIGRQGGARPGRGGTAGRRPPPPTHQND